MPTPKSQAGPGGADSTERAVESEALGIYRGSGRFDPKGERARVRKEPLAS